MDWRRVLGLLITLTLAIWTLTQCRKPSGPLGRLYVWLMNFTHSRLTNWGLKQIAVRKGDTILDVGCGGGRTIQKLAALAPEGKVFGVDYSKASVAASLGKNADAVAAGRVKVEHASVASLPFADATFDVVTAVETHYYWPDLLANFREVLRVMKPGGTFAVIAEMHRSGRFEAPAEAVMTMIRAKYMTADQHRELLVQAGFADVAITVYPGKSWICAVSRKPA